MSTPDPRSSQQIEHSSIQGSQIQQGQASRNLTQIQAENLTQNYITVFGRDRPTNREKLRLDLAEQILKNRIQPELKQRLRNTIYQEVWLNPELEEQPHQVGELTPHRLVQLVGKPAETLDLQTTILEVFAQYKKLLILGEPGIGKTTTLLTLADQLVEQAIANPGTAIPVIFELSTWKDNNQGIEEWLIQQITKIYPRVSTKIAKGWLEKDLLLPLLDGLDELEVTRQEICVQRLNQFAEHYPYLVVCCRAEEYEAGNQLDELRSAVRLQPLTPAQIQGYLQQVGRQTLWKTVLTHAEKQVFLHPDAEGKPRILQTPLFLKIAAEVYEENPFNSKTELLEAFIDRRLNPDIRKWERKKSKNQRWAYRVIEKEPDWKQTLYRLSWLAWQLKKNNQVELLIEQIQPHWIKPIRLLRLYQITIGLTVVLGNSLTGSLVFGKSVGIGAFLFGLVVSISILLDSSVLKVIKPVETFNSPISRATRPKISRIFREIVMMLFIALVTVKLSPLLDRITRYVIPEYARNPVPLSQAMTTGMIGLLILFLSIGLVATLTDVLKQDLEVKSSPNQGIWNSFQNLCWISLLSYPLGVLFASLSFTEVISKAVISVQALANAQQIIQTSLTASLLPGLFASLWFGFVFGGGFACIQHLCLRLILTCGCTLPWDYARFLDYCVERRLLQRIGGRYQFLHRELLEHFADKAGGVS